MKNILLFALLISLALSSCKPDKDAMESESNTTNREEQVTSKEERTETYQIFMVTVDNLRVREGAKKLSKVVDKLKEGSLVYSNGNHSDFTEIIALRGIQYDRPYQEITYGGKGGWAYQGGLFKIYNSEEPDSFTADLDNFALRLNRSKKTLLNKGEEILKVLRQEKSGSTEWNDMMYIMAEYHFNQIMRNDEIYLPFENKQWSADEYNSAHYKAYDMQTNEFSKGYARAGFKFDASEGMVYPIINPVAIRNSITGPISEGMQAYLAIREAEATTKMFSDGGIVCPMNTIVDYIILSENYVTSYPKALGVDKIKSELDYFNSILIHGSNNSPAIDYETKKLNQEWMTAWQRYVDQNPQGLMINKVKASIGKHNRKDG